MPSFVTIGECMLELRQVGGGLLRPGFAGDMLNSAYYARRVLPAAWQVEFLTGFGTDRVSQDMRAAIHDLGIGTVLSSTVAHRQAGLYMIHLDSGERNFSYWRSHSAARLLARDRDRIRAALSMADVVVFSGITLAILEDDDAFLVEQLAAARKAGAMVAFDPNLRPSLWPDREAMKAAIVHAAQVSSVVLPSFGDEAAHFGDADCAATLDRFSSYGAEVVALKNGDVGVSLAWQGGRSDVPATKVATVLDTTGAGDSFNGVFLSRLATGDSPDTAARHAARVAARVIQHHGAIAPDAVLPGDAIASPGSRPPGGHALARLD